MGLKLSELVASVGDENIKLQNLLDSLDAATTTKKNGTKISFFTDQITPTEIMRGSETVVGLVIWLPKDRVNAAIKSASPSRRPDPDGDT